MKTKKLIIVLIPLIIFLCSTAKAQSEKTYYYCYAYSFKYKLLYVTELFPVASDVNRARIKIQWMSHFDAFKGKGSSYEFTKEIFSAPTKAKTQSEINDHIALRKGEGFKVEYVTNFSYIED